jgi:GNAT superfamily N-acetyltransferase
VITDLSYDLDGAVQAIINFYRAKGRAAQICQGFQKGEMEILFPILRKHGFHIKIFHQRPYVHNQRSSPPSNNSHLMIRRLTTMTPQVEAFLRADGSCDANIRRFKRQLKHPESFLFTGCNPAGAMVTMAVLSITRHCARIDDVVTHESHRRCGYATALLNCLIRFYNEQEKARLLFLFAANPDAERLYKRIGFKKVSFRYPFWLATKPDDAKPM